MTCTSARYFILATVLFAGATLLAQDAILKVHAGPRSAVVFVDGQAYKQHDGTLEVPAGRHKIGIYHYGFKPWGPKEITFEAGKTLEITAKLELLPGEVNGPWGNLEVRGVKGDDLVFLNGRSPEFCIGYVDEMRGNRVVLPPGDQQVYIVRPEGNQVVNTWHVNIIANRKATFHADRNQTTYDRWPEGEKLSALPRYQAETGMMALGRVGVRLDPGNIVAMGPGGLTEAALHIKDRCLTYNAEPAPVKVRWYAINGYQVLVKQNGVAIGGGWVSGDQFFPLNTAALSPSPLYYFETFGPGGVSMTPVVIDLGKAVDPRLELTPATIVYHKVGDKVVESGSAVLHWSTNNADSVSVDQVDPQDPDRVLASVSTSPSGDQAVTFSPGSSEYGPITQTLAYKIIAHVEGCPDVVRTTHVAVAGSIDPPETTVVAENLPPVLPQTGSPLPLIGLAGLASFFTGLVMVRMRNRKRMVSPQR